MHDAIQATTPIYPYDHTAAQWHALERARLTEIGRPPSFGDGQIDAIVASNNLALVTRNTADFTELMDLTLENWFSK